MTEGRHRPIEVRPKASASECGTIAAIVVLAVVCGIGFANPAITGLYHDDGIYLATARSLAERGSYRLINLPGAPLATKYPPLYSTALAMVWKVTPSFPGNLRALKAVNTVCLAALLLLLWRLTLRLKWLGPIERTLAVALVATSPGLFSFTDLVLSDLLFTTLFLAVLLTYPRDPEAAPTRALVLAATLAALAALTRTLGLAICLGLVLYIWKQANWRRAAVALAIIVAWLAPWAFWIVTARSADANSLLQYYLAYEPSAWRLSGSAAQLVSILGANCRFFVTQAPIPFGLGGWLLGTTGAILIAIGLLRWRAAELTLIAYVAPFYAIAILGHPYPMVRYLVPWVPVAYLTIVNGVAALRGQAALRTLSLVSAGLLLLANVLWLAHFRSVTTTRIHGEFGRALPFEWSGYVDTAEWIRTNTPVEARLASSNDTLYFLYTGRLALRPWIHQPEHYTPEFGFGPPRQAPDAVQKALDDLAVRYLVIDPQLSGGEAAFARQSLESLVSREPAGWVLRFTSRDATHRVFERQSKRASERAAGFTRAIVVPTDEK